MAGIARAAAAAFLLAATLSFASAEDAVAPNNYPSHAIRMIVPFPPGGPADTLARIVGQKMAEDWGQPVVIENRPGGNTAIGAELAAKASPDGYTLLVAMDVTMVTNPLLTPSLPYDPARDFAPVSLLMKDISLVTTRDDGPATLQDLIAKAKANPGKLAMGAGTLTSRLGALAFADAAAIDVTLVPYKGSAEITQGLLTGAVDFAFDGVPNALPLIQAGKFRALAKYTERPLPVLPDVPSVAAAAGLAGLGESSTWIALFAPAQTPKPLVDKIQREVAKIFADQALAARLEKSGMFAQASTPEELGAFIRNETVRWSVILKSGLAAKILN
jgi:tripartite-type tricarboxylate transporter receptor subunit TctC